MKTQDTDAVEAQKTSPQKKGETWRTIGTLIIVALIVGVSVVVFTQLGQHTGKGTQQPPSGQWVEILNGYTVTWLVAAPSNPSVLYACANRAGYTLLKSTDGGMHWQDIGKNVGFTGSCQLAINPADSNDLYVVIRAASTSNLSTFSEVLKHSTDSGQTWKSISPTLSVSGLSSPVEWHVQQLTVVGNHLFGLQAIPIGSTQQQQGVRSPFPAALLRLITSVDGGQHWTVLDEQFQAASLEVRSYAVDPSDANIVYELVGRSISGTVPKNAQPAPTSTSIVAPYGTDGDLYKTINAGGQWQLVLKGLPFGAAVQLAPDKPAMIYAGGTISPLPAGANGLGAPSFGSSSYSPGEVGSFHLQMSSDSGTTWQEIPALPPRTFVQTWFVGTGGRVFGLSGVSANKNTIHSYDPATRTWSEINPPQPSGSFVAVTTTRSNSGVALWYQTSVDGKALLYRYIM